MRTKMTGELGRSAMVIVMMARVHIANHVFESRTFVFMLLGIKNDYIGTFDKCVGSIWDYVLHVPKAPEKLHEFRQAIPNHTAHLIHICDTFEKTHDNLLCCATAAWIRSNPHVFEWTKTYWPKLSAYSRRSDHCVFYHVPGIFRFDGYKYDAIRAYYGVLHAELLQVMYNPEK